jgi:hypothetical protein
VVSYTTVSPLPVPGPSRSRARHRRSVFCGTVPRVTPGGRYPPPCPVEPGRSSATPGCPGTDAAAQPARPPCAKGTGRQAFAKPSPSPLSAGPRLDVLREVRLARRARRDAHVPPPGSGAAAHDRPLLRGRGREHAGLADNANDARSRSGPLHVDHPCGSRRTNGRLIGGSRHWRASSECRSSHNHGQCLHVPPVRTSLGLERGQRYRAFVRPPIRPIATAWDGEATVCYDVPWTTAPCPASGVTNVGGWPTSWPASRRRPT